MPKFILRVDDVGWLPPDKTRDVGMEYFSRWRKALGSNGSPVYYGAIPRFIGVEELNWLSANLYGGEELAVHGDSHTAGEIVTLENMRHSVSIFSQAAPCRSYIAPFNNYNAVTVKDWGEAWPGGYFFGGFSPFDHPYGISPVMVGDVTHLPATRKLYDHTIPLIRNLEEYLQENGNDPETPPVVVTLHATWGRNEFDLLPRVMELIRSHLVPVTEARDWALKNKGS